MTTITTSSDQTKQLAKELVNTLQGGDVITLKGDLGSGKTTFTQGVAEGLGIRQKVNSPTFLISKSYTIDGQRIKTLHHIDLYRLQNQEEIKNIGILEIFKDRDSITIIEWPERMGEYLPKKRIAIEFKYLDETEREITTTTYA